jgi:hypothetical protein
MLRRQIPTAIMLSGILVLAMTAGVLAKGDAIVTLDASLPADPEPGTELTVGWTLETLGENGERFPFNAEAVFVRLVPASGEPVEVVGRQGPLGHYVATVTVPAGGIRDVEVGLRGESCTGGTCQRSDIMFAIDDSATPLFAAAPARAGGANPGGAGDGAAAAPESAAGSTSLPSMTSDALPMGLLGLALALAAIVVAIAVVRMRGRALTTGSSRS